MFRTVFSRPRGIVVSLFAGLALLGSAGVGLGQTSALSGSRLPATINEAERVTLAGNVHPLASAKNDRGPVLDSLPMEHMYLQLRRTPEQEQALTALLADMQDPKSPKYHQWLTADELGKTYGPSTDEINTVVRWLESHGMQVHSVSKSGLTLDVSASAGQLREALHTEIHNYSVRGKQYIANATDPQIPAALSKVVAGFNSLNSFRPRPLLKKRESAFTFNYGGYEQYDEAPADFAKIYNVAPLYTAKQPITGKGQTVVVLEVTDIDPADVATFRSAFGLSSYAGTFTQIHPGSGCSDPGKNGAEGEAALDSEWAGAVAPDAKVELASCADSTTNFGAFIAAQNLLDLKTPPPIMSLSYSSCEVEQGPSGNYYTDLLWEQAALEGVSVFVATGDNGPAACDNPDTESYAVAGVQANGFASTPFDTATGGTDFLDTAYSQNGVYWTTTNSKAGASAKSYVPEMTWNDSCASSVLDGYYGISSPLTFCNTGYFLDISAGSGAPSFVYSKPYWQGNVVGNPSDGVRDLPDVSLFASNGFWNHSILFCMSDSAEGGVPCDYNDPVFTESNSAGGTSFTAPQFASIQALINQKAGAPQGNAAPTYYNLGREQYGSPAAPNRSQLSACNATLGKGVASTCVFHDVQSGTIDVPCYGTNNCYGSAGLNYGVSSTSDTTLQIAYPTHGGWDFGTGLGSVNVTNLVNRWP